MTHICVGKLTIIAPDNGLSPGRHQAIIWTNAGILLIEPLGTNFSEILIGIQTFPFKKLPLKMSSAKWRPFCLGLNELTLVQIMAWCFSSTKPLHEPMLTYHHWGFVAFNWGKFHKNAQVISHIMDLQHWSWSVSSHWPRLSVVSGYSSWPGSLSTTPGTPQRPPHSDHLWPGIKEINNTLLIQQIIQLVIYIDVY